VKNLVLGGIAQQKIVITEEDRSNLEKNGFTTSNSAELSAAAGNIFSVSVGFKQSQDVNKEKLGIFKNYSKQSSATTLGGDTSIQTIEDWSKTVPTNPVIIKFGISLIFDLLTSERFPGDVNITDKAELIQAALDKYMANPVFCYNNCKKGTCKPSGYFQFGLCQCDKGYTGYDCSKEPVAKSPVPKGTLCGFWSENRGGIKCDNSIPSNGSGCRPGYIFQNNFAIPSQTGMSWMGSCFKNETNNNQLSNFGTLCGFVTESSSETPITVHCNGRHPYNQACPDGYERQILAGWSTCVKIDSNQDDLPGTLCGMHVRREIEYNEGNPNLIASYRCNDYNVQDGYCPPGYQLANGLSSLIREWGLSYRQRLMFCFKL
jgi:hypothetical protein